MKSTIFTFLSIALLTINVNGQYVSKANTKSQPPGIGKLNWSIDPFEHAIFVENTGEFDKVLPGERIYFEAKLGAIAAYFTTNGILYKLEKNAPLDFSNGKDPDQDGPPIRTSYYLRTYWAGASANVTVDASLNDKLAYYYTYPNGTSDTYFANVYKKISYHNIYPGIDIIYSFSEGSNNLEYTIIVHPGADLNKVKLNYQKSREIRVDRKGNVIDNNEIGIIKESSPIGYYLEDKSPVNINTEVNNSNESFIVHNLDATKTLAIDPIIQWSTIPFTASTSYDYAFDLDYDNLGNVYCYGGGTGNTTHPLQLVKLSPAGTILWVYNATTMVSSTDFYGDFAVDKHSLECYCVEGWNASGGARQEKISPSGALIATDPGNSGFNEMWRIQSTICPPGFVVFGNGTCCPDHAAMVDTTMTATNPVNIIGAACTTGYHDMALTAVDPFGGYALTFTTHSLSYGNTFDNELIKSPIPALAPYSFMVGEHYNFYEIGSIFYDPDYVFNAMNGLVCGRLWIYSYNGDTLKQINRNSGIINRVTQITSTTAFDCGGLDVDLCDNVYVGNSQTIEVFDSTLSMTSTLPVLPGIIYDLKLGPYTGQLLYACGQNFISSISLGPPQTVPITITKGPSSCGVCSGTATVSAMQCGVLDTLNITYLWSDGETTRSASHLCSGIDSVGVTIVCGLTYYDTVTIATSGVSSFTLTTTVTNATCSTLGSSAVAVSGGSSPFTYSWSPGGQTTSTASGLSAGTYTITVHDNTGCTQTASSVITSSSSLVANITSSTNVSCHSGTNGTATVTVSGGISLYPYTYSWSPSGGTTVTGTGLSAGTYTVTVSNNGCTATAVVTITQPTAISATTTSTQSTCSASNGTASVSASGGTPVYTYSWNPSTNTGTTATGLSAGIYTVTVTDNNGCTFTVTASVSTTSGLSASISASTNILCNGGTTGSATVTESGGTSPFTYSWSPSGGSSSTGTGLSAGTYTVSVTDANGCIVNSTVTITQPTALTATPGVTTNILCNGGTNGSASVTAANGTSPYTYSWSPGGGTTSSGTGLSAGTFTVTITDNNGCTASSTATITQPTAITATTTTTQATCGASNGTATVAASGGTPVYTYSWNPSANTGVTASGLSVGTYTITVTDNNGCTFTATASVTSTSGLTASISASTNVSCNGGSDGTATVTESGGSSPFTYAWASAGGSTSTGTGLSAGTYTVTVTDANGCNANATVTITQPALLTAAMGAPTNVVCNGGTTGSATVTAGGGASPYTYAWVASGGSNASGTGLSAGTYTVTITDNNGCTATATATITQPAAITATTSTTQATCGASNGTATASAGGGTSPYTYLWNPSGGSNATATGLSVGVYTVTVTDNNGCTLTTPATITSTSGLTAGITASTNVSCNGASDGTATVTPSGGSSPYTYAWASAGGTGAMGTGLSAGTYTVTVTDSSGCTAIATTTITQPTLLTASMGIPTNVNCNGGTTGSATVTAGGGASPYTYAWASAGGTGAMGTGLSAGTYTVTVTDSSGCTAIATTTITQPTLLTASMGIPTNVNCNGGTTGSATVTAGGGASPYTYAWASAGGTSATGIGLSAGTYTVTITDNNGCTATATATITQPAAITATTSTTQATCGNNNGTATVTAAGGTSPYTYLWNPSGGSNVTATGLSVGAYTVMVTDNNGCTFTTTANITSSSGLSASITSSTNISCNGGTNGSATAGVTGGSSPYTYSWTATGGANATANGLSAGTYTITVTDNNGCSAVNTVTLTQPLPVTASMGVPTNVSCNGGTNGSATVTAAGGTSPYTYAWASAGGTSATGIGLSAGTYTLTVTDNNGCTATATATITQPPAITASIGAPVNVVCNGQSNGSATVTVAGGNTPYTYSWAPGGITSATGAGLSAGTYSVTVTDHTGCSSSASVTITQPAVLSVTLTTSPITCAGVSNGSIAAAAAGGTSPYTYVWQPPGGNGATASNLGAGTYTLSISDARGCTVSASATITEPPVLAVTASGPTTICSGANATLSSTISGGNLPYTYSWSSGATTAATVVNPASTTIYTLTITDASGCTAIATVTVITDQPLNVVISGATSFCAGDSAYLSATASGGNGAYTFLWSPGANTTYTIVANPSSTTVYTVELTDGCGSAPATDTATVSVHPLPVTSFEATPYSGCPPLCVQFRDLTTVGGGTITQWNWYFGVNDTNSVKDPILCYPDTGKFSVSLTTTSSFGCRSTLTKIDMITVYPPPKANFTYSPESIEIVNPVVQFTSTSTSRFSLINWFWNFGDGSDSTSYQVNPQHTYSDTGTYCVTLIVTNQQGCADTATNCLIVNPLFTLYIPDAFTPNADGLNEVFMPKGTYVKNYEMYIYNRWEAQLFHSSDMSIGWNGRVNGNGNICQEDNYYYLINVTDSRGKNHSYTGQVNLLK